jgi:hypothetical protein
VKLFKHIFLRLLLVAIPLLMAMAPAMAQDTVFAHQATDLTVVEVPGDTYVWELYNDTVLTGINMAVVHGNCPAGDAYFTNGPNGPTVNVMWNTPGLYFFKVTAFRAGCTNNLKVGKLLVLPALPTAVIEPPPPICQGDSVHLTVTLTGTPPWSITLTDGVNEYVYSNITSSPYTLTVPRILPPGNTTYWIKDVTDEYGTNTTPSPQVEQVVHPKPGGSRIYQYEPVVKK